ncbi:NAD(P)/FAD-dependent oxidoreductase [Motiliproteus coralliicola]|nr:FAD-dependent oxidoreductase [Motiliproteus coralliicola]
MSTDKPHLIIIGNGMAGGRLLSELQQHCPDRYRITVFGAEPGGSYNRVLLSPLLGREIDTEALITHRPDWYADQGIQLISDCRIERIEPQQRRLIDTDGQAYHYDKLVLATGSEPSRLGVAGETLPQVMGFRTLVDVDRLQQLARKDTPAVVIGGGLLGLEAAEGLRRLGMDVTLVHRSQYLLNRQLDQDAASLLQQQLESRGLKFELGANTAAFIGQQSLEAVELQDGRRLPAALAVVATGITPNTQLAREAELACDRAIQVDAQLHTSSPGIYALGECCQFESHCYGLVAPIWRQAEVLAKHLAGESIRYEEVPVATQLKISGIELFSCGRINTDSNGAVETDGSIETLCYQDPELNDYRKLLLRDNRLIGAVLYGDVSTGQWYFEQQQRGTDLGLCLDQLLFGPDYCDELLAAATESALAAQPSIHESSCNTDDNPDTRPAQPAASNAA